MVGERVVVMLVEEAADADFLSGLNLDVTTELLRVAAVEDDLVRVVVLVSEGLDLGVADAVDVGHEVVHRPGVDGPAELDLCLDLVSVGHGDVAHRVGEAGDADVAALVDADGDALPGAKLLKDALVLPVTEDHLVGPAHAGEDVPQLALAVSGLILVHEVHVDRVVRNLLVVLRRELAQRLGELLESVDVRLGGREGVRPGDDAGALGIGVRRGERRRDHVVGEQVGLEDDLEGDLH